MCQLLNKRPWMSCVREVASPQLDCLLDFARISTCCAEAWVAGLCRPVAWDHSHKESSPPGCSHPSLPTAPTALRRWYGYCERSRVALTLGMVPGPSPPGLYKLPKKIFLCCSVLIVTRSGGITQRRLMRAVLYKTVTVRTC